MQPETCSWIALPLVVVFGIELAVGAGDGLRSFVGFEAQIALLVFVGLVLDCPGRCSRASGCSGPARSSGSIASTDCSTVDRVGVFALEKENAAEIVQRDAIARILRENFAEMVGRFVVVCHRCAEPSRRKNGRGPDRD